MSSRDCEEYEESPDAVDEIELRLLLCLMGSVTGRSAPSSVKPSSGGSGGIEAFDRVGEEMDSCGRGGRSFNGTV